MALFRLGNCASQWEPRGGTRFNTVAQSPSATPSHRSEESKACPYRLHGHPPDISECGSQQLLQHFDAMATLDATHTHLATSWRLHATATKFLTHGKEYLDSPGGPGGGEGDIPSSVWTLPQKPRGGLDTSTRPKSARKRQTQTLLPKGWAVPLSIGTNPR